MPNTTSTKSTRVNISLSQHTLRLIDSVAKKGGRSRLIDRAVRHYISQTSRYNLREALKEGAQINAVRDAAIADEWFGLEEELWENKQK